MFVSSVNTIGIKMDTGKSLVKNKNKSGPKMDPNGTPYLISLESDLQLLYTTYWYLLLR